MEEKKDFANIIGGNHIINKDIWALSLVRKFNADHGYLIMEGISDDNQRIIMDAHLVVKTGSNEKKAKIIYRDISGNNKLQELQKIGQSCSSYTWNISRFQADTFVSLVQSEQQRADEDKINYVQFGPSKISGGFVSLPDDAKASLGNYSDNAFMDTLLREGHNCGSWAIAMVRALQLPFKGNYVPFIFSYIPPIDIDNGHHDGDAEPDSTQNCLMM